MISGAMDFECLVELWVVDIWWSYGLWMFSGAMGLGCLVEIWALEVWFSRNKRVDNRERAEIIHYNRSHTQHQ